MTWPSRATRIAAAAVPVHVALALATDLSPDEAYYLCAARASRTHAPIVDHPPLIVWLLRVTDGIEGVPLELRVRCIPIVLSFATTIAATTLSRELGADEKGARLVACATTFALLPLAGGFLATPDAPLVLGVVVAALSACRSPRSVAGGLAQATIVAAALALASLAKVAALPIAIAFALGAASWWARGGALVGPLLALPLLLPSLRFQLGHAFADRGGLAWSPVAAVLALLEACGAQCLLWSPWTLLAGWRSLRPVAERGGRHVVLATVGLTALVLASALARGVPPEPNWWAPAAVMGVASAGAHAWSTRARRATLAWLLLPAALIGAHTLRPFLPLPISADPTARLHGWSTGSPPLAAPGIGRYGAAAESCTYLNKCDEIDNYFNN